MSEYIDRETAMALEVPPKRYRRYQTDNLDDAYEQGWEDALSSLRYEPAADVVPVRHGNWKTNSDIPDTLICSECGCRLDMWKHEPHGYCPGCGSKMEVN